MKMTTLVTIKMSIEKPHTIYFNPPLLNVKEIQLIEIWVPLNSYLIYCDIIDSQYSLTNFEKSEILTPSKLIGLFPRGEPNISLPINKNVLSNLTITFKNTDMTTPKNSTAILNLKIIHE